MSPFVINTIIPAIIRNQIARMPMVAGVIDGPSSLEAANSSRPTDTCDGVHLTSQGDTKLARAVFDAIAPILRAKFKFLATVSEGSTTQTLCDPL